MEKLLHTILIMENFFYHFGFRGGADLEAAGVKRSGEKKPQPQIMFINTYCSSSYLCVQLPWDGADEGGKRGGEKSINFSAQCFQVIDIEA